MKIALLLLPVLALPAPAHAFKRSTTEQGGDVCLYWPGRSLSWQAASPLGAEEAAILPALRASFAAWDAVACTDLSLKEGSRTSREVGYDRSGANQNVVLFRSESSCDRYRDDPCFDRGTCPDEHDCWDYPPQLLAVTTTTFDRCGQLLDADIEFNGGDFAFTAVDGPPCDGSTTTGCVAFDVQNTATHEIGHLLGLDHPEGSSRAVKESTMYVSAGAGETKKRTLAQDDVDGICSIYPTGKPAVACRPAQECAARTREESTCSVSGGEASLLSLALAALAIGRRRRRR